MGTLKNKILWIGVAILIVVAILASIVAPNVYKLGLSEEDRLAMTYHQFTDAEKKVENCENVEFLAYFARDLNKDGIAEKLAGTTLDMSSTDVLYMELNVISDGTLEDGQISFSSGNNYKVELNNLLKDGFFAQNYINVADASEINLDRVNAGTQRLVLSSIAPRISSDGSNFTKDSKVTLTGTWVSSDGATRTPIRKEVTLTVDWHGTTYAFIDAPSENIKRTIIQTDEEYDTDDWGLSTLPEYTADPFNVTIRTEDRKKQLPLVGTTTTVKVPSLWGYYPEWINVSGGTYNEENHTITFTSAGGGISYNNSYSFRIKYPLQAYRACFYGANGQIQEDAKADFLFEITSSYSGKNNENYTNPYTTTAKTNMSVVINLDRGGPTPMEIITKGVDFHKEVYAKSSSGNRVFDGNKLLAAYNNTDQKYFYYVVDYKIENRKSTYERVSMHNVEADKLGSHDLTLYETDCFFFVDKYNFESVLGEQGFINAYGVQFENEMGTIYEHDLANARYEHAGDLTYQKRGTVELTRDSTYTRIYLDNVFGKSFTDDIFNELRRSEWDYIVTGTDFGNIQTDNPDESQSQYGAPTWIKLETSAMAPHSELVISVVKRVNLDLLRRALTIDQIKQSGTLRSYLDFDKGASIQMAYAKSEANISWNGYNTTFETQNTENPVINKSFTISTKRADGLMYSEWKDGEFVVVLPADFINVDVKSVTGDGVNISGYTLNKDKTNNVYYIKILTENNSPVKSENITVNIDVTPDARAKSKTAALGLYYYNNYCDEYYNTALDIYDANNNGSKADYVGYTGCATKIQASETLITVQTVTDYDDEGSITVAPNSAELSKATRSANINISVTNNYKASVTGTKILGRVPYQGNKYVLIDREMGSDFTAAMTGPIVVPESIRENTTVYYTEVGEPGKDISDAANGWKTAEEVTNWASIKSYLIDFSGITLYSGYEYEFYYPVTIPEGLNYNDSSYATHSVEYDYIIPTENSTLHFETEPTKVGLKIARLYNLTGVKFKEFKDLRVKGAIYELAELNSIGDIVKKTALISDSNGNFSAQGVYVNATYVVKEISAPQDYLLSNKEYKFKVEEKEDGTLEFKYISEDHFRTEAIQKDEDNNDLVYIEIEDEPKYQLNVTYIDKTKEEPISSAVVRIGETTKSTNGQGKVSFERLLPGEEYQLQEVYIKGNTTENYDFDLTRNGNTYTATADEGMIIESIVNDEENHLIQLNVRIEKESNPTYTLEIVKVEKDASKTDLADMKKLPGAVFTLESDQDGELGDFTTDANGKITVEKLYQYVSGRTINGKYKLTEKTAPEGYIINGEEVTFVVSKENDELKVDFEDDLTSIKDVIIDGNKVTFVIQDTAYFKLTKISSEKDNEGHDIPLANAKFVIYEIDTDGNIIDCAKDIYGNYVGTQDEGAGEDSPYYVYTNAAGEISLPLRDGKYQIEEVEAPAGYEGESVQTFEVKNNPTTETGNASVETPYVAQHANIPEIEIPEISEENTIVINYIEDLIDVGIQIANDNTYAGKKLVLQRNLDITDRNSYRAPDDNTTYGDYDEDEETKTIFEEVNGPKGLKPLGRYLKTEYSISYYAYDKGFSGVFDGNNKTINLVSTQKWGSHQNDGRYDKGGLFACLNDGIVLNLGITGDIYADGAIASGFLNGFTLYNCYNKANIDGQYNNPGGLIGSNASDSFDNGEHHIRIENCYNEGTLKTLYVNGALSNNSDVTGSGIIGNLYLPNSANVQSIIIKDCYNKGNCTIAIAGTIQLSKNTRELIIYNCKEESDYCGSLIGQISMYNSDQSSDTMNIIIEKCTNKAKNPYKHYIGGIVSRIDFNNSNKEVNFSIVDCINEANMDTTYTYGGIVSYICGNSSNNHNTSVEIVNCINKGNITCQSSANIGGIVGEIRYLKNINIVNCTNEGDITCTDSSGSAMAGIVSYFDYIKGNINIDGCKQLGTLTNCASAVVYKINDLSPIVNIKNININNPTSIIKNDNAGGILAAFYTNGEVNIENCNVKIGSIYANYYPGGILGYSISSGGNNKTNIKNCTFEGSISNSTSGGMLGYGNGLIKIEDCSVKGTISGTSSTGGIAGLFYDENSSGESSYIKRCNVDATITGTGSYIGGIIGQCNQIKANIENCSVKGYIECNSSYAGGIAGFTSETNIKKCVNYADINTLRYVSYIGGILAQNSSYSNQSSHTQLENVYNYGNIIVINRGMYVGGLVGYGSNVEVKNSYNKGDIFADGVSYTCGIAGFVISKIENCYNEGDILSFNNTYAAGLVCANYWDTTVIKNSYNTGDITSDVGAAGLVYNGSSYVTISNCYNTGNVISNNDNYLGSIVGANSGAKIENTYYADNITLGSSKAEKNGTEVSYDYMKTRDFYNKLNVDGVWVQKDGQLPTFKFKMPVFGEATELTITNDKVDYIIRTKALTGGTISGSNEVPYETVEAGDDNEKVIEATPSEGYKLTNLLINGKNIALESNADDKIDFTEGKLTLSPGYFSKMSENKMVTAIFSSDNVYEFTKVDEDDNTIKLTGAEFSVASYNRSEYESKFGAFTNVEGLYGFTENNGIYTSTNQGVQNSVAMMYMPIDLRDYTSGTSIVFNYDTVPWDGVSNKAFWYASETLETPTAPYTQYNTFNGTGTWNSISLEGGKQYYLYFGYYKDDTVLTDKDELSISIDSITLYDQFEGTLKFDDVSTVQFTSSYNKLYLKETKAPEGYDIDPTVHEIVYDAEHPSYTITNKKTVPAQVTVHHYLIQDGVKTTNKVAEDEYLLGAIGDGYVTGPKDLDGLIVNMTEFPENAIGVYSNTPAEVIYYYDVDTVDLTIHHYRAGTTTAIVPDETVSVKPEITLDAENSTYTLAELTYVLNTNTNYNTLVAGNYNFVDVYSNAEDNLTIESTLHYSGDSELTYTYTDKIFDIMTRVKNHTETRFDPITEEEIKEDVAGGTISGQNLAVYEQVASGEDATKDIIVEANTGYLVKSIVITSTAEDGTETSKVLYGTGAEDCEITYTETVTGKTITLAKFEDLSANKTVTVEFIPQGTRALVHHIIQGQTEDYRTETITGNVGDYYTTSSITIPGYGLISSSLNTTGYLSEEVIDVYYYYGPVESEIIIEYRDIIDNTLLDSETLTGRFGDSITLADYEKEITNYVLRESPEEETATFAADSQTFIFKYAKIATVRAIYVVEGTDTELADPETETGYEGKEYTTAAKTVTNYTLKETPANATGTMTVTETSSETLVRYEYVLGEALVVEKYIDINTNEVVKTANHAGHIGDPYTINPSAPTGYTIVEVDGEGNSLLPTNATGSMTATTIEVIYYVDRPVDDSTKVVEKYVDINTNQAVKTEDHNGHVGDPYNIVADVPDGYVLIEEDKHGNSLLPTNSSGTMTADVIEVIYYVAREAKVTVEYVDKDTDEKLANDIEISGYEGKAYTTEEKSFTDYVLKEIIGDAAGNMEAGDQVVSYKYEKEEEPLAVAYVRVIYIDTDTKEKIADDDLITGYEGKPYTTTAKEIEDYEILVVPINAKGVMTITVDGEGNVINEILVKYIYKKNKDTKVVEKYVDINSKDVVESKDHPGRVGDLYEVTPTIPKGYKLIEKDKDGNDILPENTSGRMTEEVIEVIFYVAKDAKVKAKYVVKYGGKDIADEVEIEGYEGKEYSVDPKDIDGYELIEIDGKPEGTMKAGENLVTFYYAKKAAGIIPQTGINGIKVFLYAMLTLVVISTVNGIVFLVYKFRK